MKLLVRLAAALVLVLFLGATAWIDRRLPSERKIRVVVMAIGWVPDMRGYDEVAATREARAAGLLVVCSSIETVQGFKFHGLGRDPLAAPDDFTSFGPGRSWASGFTQHLETLHGRLRVPMDSRPTAGFTTRADYAFSRQGGWSRAIPFIAGAYALAAPVKPAVTPDEFWALALKTGRMIAIDVAGRRVPFGPIVDPASLIAAPHTD